MFFFIISELDQKYKSLSFPAHPWTEISVLDKSGRPRGSQALGTADFWVFISLLISKHHIEFLKCARAWTPLGDGKDTSV